MQSANGSAPLVERHAALDDVLRKALLGELPNAERAREKAALVGTPLYRYGNGAFDLKGGKPHSQRQKKLSSSCPVRDR